MIWYIYMIYIYTSYIYIYVHYTISSHILQPTVRGLPLGLLLGLRTRSGSASRSSSRATKTLQTSRFPGPRWWHSMDLLGGQNHMIPKNHTYQLDKTYVWLINNIINTVWLIWYIKKHQRTIIYIYRSPIDHRYHRHLLVIGEIIYLYIHRNWRFRWRFDPQFHRDVRVILGGDHEIHLFPS